MNEIKNSIKENITVSIPKIIIEVLVIISSIIGFRKGKSTKSKVISCISGVAAITTLGLEIEKEFKPIDDIDSEEEE